MCLTVDMTGRKKNMRCEGIDTGRERGRVRTRFIGVWKNGVQYKSGGSCANRSPGNNMQSYHLLQRLLVFCSFICRLKVSHGIKSVVRKFHKGQSMDQGNMVAFRRQTMAPGRSLVGWSIEVWYLHASRIGACLAVLGKSCLQKRFPDYFLHLFC